MLKKIVWYSVEYALAIVFGILSISFIARQYGASNYGMLASMQSVAAITLFIVVFGLDHVLVKESAAGRLDKYGIKKIFIFQLFLSLIYFFSTLILVYVVENEGFSELAPVLIVVLIANYFNRATVLKQYYQGAGEAKLIGYSSLFSRGVSVLYIVWCYYFSLEYVYAILFLPIQAVSQFVFLVLFGRVEERNDQDFNPIDLKNIIMESFPLMISMMFFPLFIEADIFILSIYFDDEIVGNYAAAARLVSQFFFVGHVLVLPFYPMIVKGIEGSDCVKNYIEDVSLLLVSASFFIVISITIVGGYVVDILLGEGFLSASGILNILVLKLLFLIPAALYSRLLVNYGLQNIELIKSLVIGLISVVLNLIFVEKYGVYFAAVMSVFSFIMADFLIYVFFKESRWIFFVSLKSYVYIFLKPVSSFSRIYKMLRW